MPPCSVCSELLPPAAFSNAQLKKPSAQRRCKGCSGASPSPSAGASTAASQAATAHADAPTAGAGDGDGNDGHAVAVPDTPLFIASATGDLKQVRSRVCGDGCHTTQCILSLYPARSHLYLSLSHSLSLTHTLSLSRAHPHFIMRYMHALA